MLGKRLYNKYRKAYGKVLIKSEFPALRSDWWEELPAWEALTDHEQKVWEKIAKK